MAARRAWASPSSRATRVAVSGKSWGRTTVSRECQVMMIEMGVPLSSSLTVSIEIWSTGG
jgi:hypothetical protein